MSHNILSYNIPSFDYCVNCNKRSNDSLKMHVLHAAFIYSHKCKLLAAGINSGARPLFGCNIPSLHAEMDALRILFQSYKKARFKQTKVAKVNYGCR